MNQQYSSKYREYNWSCKVVATRLKIEEVNTTQHPVEDRVELGKRSCSELSKVAAIENVKLENYDDSSVNDITSGCDDIKSCRCSSRGYEIKTEVVLGNDDCYSTPIREQDTDTTFDDDDLEKPLAALLKSSQDCKTLTVSDLTETTASDSKEQTKETKSDSNDQPDESVTVLKEEAEESILDTKEKGETVPDSNYLKTSDFIREKVSIENLCQKMPVVDDEDVKFICQLNPGSIDEPIIISSDEDVCDFNYEQSTSHRKSIEKPKKLIDPSITEPSQTQKKNSVPDAPISKCGQLAPADSSKSTRRKKKTDSKKRHAEDLETSVIPLKKKVCNDSVSFPEIQSDKQMASFESKRKSLSSYKANPKSPSRYSKPEPNAKNSLTASSNREIAANCDEQLVPRSEKQIDAKEENFSIEMTAEKLPSLTSEIFNVQPPPAHHSVVAREKLNLKKKLKSGAFTIVRGFEKSKKKCKNGSKKIGQLLSKTEIVPHMEKKRKSLSDLDDKVEKVSSFSSQSKIDLPDGRTSSLSECSTVTLTSVEDEFATESIISSPERLELSSEFHLALSDDGEETMVFLKSDSEFDTTVLECTVRNSTTIDNKILNDSDIRREFGFAETTEPVAELDQTLQAVDDDVPEVDRDENQNMIGSSLEKSLPDIPKDVTFEEGELEHSICNSTFVYNSKFLTIRIGSTNSQQCRSKDFISKLRVLRNRKVFLNSYHFNLKNQSIYSSTREELIKTGFLYCDKCPLIYSPNLFSCLDCDMYFECVVARDHHYSTEHHDSNVLLNRVPNCSLCGIKYTCREEFLKHKVTHYCANHVECPCGCRVLIVGKNSDLQNHIRTMHSMTPQKVILGSKSSDVAEGSDLACGSSLDNLVVCTDCEQMAVPKDSTGFMCTKCPPETVTPIHVFDEFLWHMQEKHDVTAMGKFRCILCPTQDDNYDNDLGELRKHRFISHSVCHNHIKCIEPSCEALLSENSLSSHLTSDCSVFEVDHFAKEQPSKKFEVETIKYCNECKNIFPTSNCFFCKYCDATFVSEKEFYAHIHYDHGVPVMIPRHVNYTCSLCYLPWRTEEDDGPSKWRDHRHQYHNICRSHVFCKKLKCFYIFSSTKLRDQHMRNSSCRKFASSEDVYAGIDTILNNYGQYRVMKK